MYRPFPNQEFRNFFQTRLEIPAMLRAFPIARGLRILEVGCGRGIALPIFARRCSPSRLAGIDISAELIALAEDRARRHGIATDLHIGDVRDLPFEEGEFDVVIDFGTCYHIDQPELALREIDRVLADDGVFIHESRFAQLLAHPMRTSFRRLPWETSLNLTAERHALLWMSRRKTGRWLTLPIEESRHVQTTP